MVVHAHSISKAGTSDQDLSLSYNRDHVFVRDGSHTNDNLIADNLFNNDSGLPTSDTCYHNDERLPIPECMRNAPSCPLEHSSDRSNVRYQHHDYRERCADLTFGAASSLGQPHAQSHSRSARERRSYTRLRDPPSFHGGGTRASRPFSDNAQPALPSHRTTRVHSTIEPRHARPPRQLYPSIITCSDAPTSPSHSSSDISRRTRRPRRQQTSRSASTHVSISTSFSRDPRLEALRRDFRAANRGIQNRQKARRPIPQTFRDNEADLHAIYLHALKAREGDLARELSAARAVLENKWTKGMQERVSDLRGRWEQTKRCRKHEEVRRRIRVVVAWLGGS